MRSAGILLPVTALPGGYGIGTLGAAARQFLDFLQAGGQRVWQMLPLGPTGFGDSPYQCFSSFAGNPYLIDLDDLCRDGLLKREEYAPLDWGHDPGRVDYGLLYRQRFAVLAPATRRARERFPQEYAAYCKAQAAWLAGLRPFYGLKRLSERRILGPLARAPAPPGPRRPAPRPGAIGPADCLLAGGAVPLLPASGPPCAAKLPTAAFVSSATCPSTPPMTAPMSGPRRTSSSWAPTCTRRPSPGARRTRFPPTGQLWGNPLYDWPRMARDHLRLVAAAACPSICLVR